MDWKKTKNILIIALIVMNMILAYNIYFSNDSSDGDGRDLSVVQQLMEERNINISRIDHQTYGEMPVYSVAKSKYSLATLSNLENRGFLLSEEGEILKMDLAFEGRTLEEENLLVAEVLQSAEITEADSKLIYDDTFAGIRRILYYQKSGSDVFDDGFLRFEIRPGKSIEVWYQWLDIEQSSEVHAGEIYPMEKSILSLLEIQSNDASTLDILSFEIVYHVDQPEDLVIDTLATSQPRPYWKVMTRSGETYYFNGLR